MVLAALIVMSFLFPIATIGAFVIGYNVNAQKKILKPHIRKKTEPTEDEQLLDWIDKAKV